MIGSHDRLGTVLKLKGMARTDDLLRTLRGEPAMRPTIDLDFQRSLREVVKEALMPVSDGVDALQVSKERLNQVHQCEGRYVHDRRDPPNVAMVRGMLIHRAIQKTLDGQGGRSPQRLTEGLLERCSKSDKPVGDLVRSLDGDDRQQLTDDIVDAVVSYSEMVPHAPPAWVRSEVETCARVTPSITLRGRIDIKLGQKSERASTVLIDLKTGRPSGSDRDDLRFYSLIETLGTGGQPYRFANVYLQSQTYEAEDVSEAVLWSTARRTTDGIAKIVELDAGREPELTPGPVCRFCPVKDVCPKAFNETDGEEEWMSTSGLPG